MDDIEDEDFSRLSIIAAHDEVSRKALDREATDVTQERFCEVAWSAALGERSQGADGCVHGGTPSHGQGLAGLGEVVVGLFFGLLDRGRREAKSQP
jgi:hypothetical protein